jgi:hypothetical protein
MFSKLYVDHRQHFFEQAFVLFSYIIRRTSHYFRKSETENMCRADVIQYLL